MTMLYDRGRITIHTTKVETPRTLQRFSYPVHSVSYLLTTAAPCSTYDEPSVWGCPYVGDGSDLVEAMVFLRDRFGDVKLHYEYRNRDDRLRGEPSDRASATHTLYHDYESEDRFSLYIKTRVYGRCYYIPQAILSAVFDIRVNSGALGDPHKYRNGFLRKDQSVLPTDYGMESSNIIEDNAKMCLIQEQIYPARPSH